MSWVNDSLNSQFAQRLKLSGLHFTDISFGGWAGEVYLRIPTDCSASILRVEGAHGRVEEAGGGTRLYKVTRDQQWKLLEGLRCMCRSTPKEYGCPQCNLVVKFTPGLCNTCKGLEESPTDLRTRLTMSDEKKTLKFKKEPRFSDDQSEEQMWRSVVSAQLIQGASMSMAISNADEFLLALRARYLE